MSVIIALLTTEPVSLELEQAVDVKGSVVRTVNSWWREHLVSMLLTLSRSVQQTHACLTDWG